jgi:hypothetical protein
MPGRSPPAVRLADLAEGGGVLDRDLEALSSVGLATGTVRARVAELGATQADTLALRERLASQEATIGQLLATRKAMLATARAQVRALGFAHLADTPAPNRTAAAAVRAGHVGGHVQLVDVPGGQQQLKGASGPRAYRSRTSPAYSARVSWSFSSERSNAAWCRWAAWMSPSSLAWAAEWASARISTLTSSRATSRCSRAASARARPAHPARGHPARPGSARE